MLLLALSKYRHEGSGAQLVSYLGLHIINNVREARDSLHHMVDDFRLRNARSTKPCPYKAGDSVLLSMKHVNLNLPGKKSSVLLSLGRIPLDLFLVPTGCASITRSAFNY